MAMKSPLKESHEELLALIGKGHTAAMIARHFGVTRNSVIGYCSRRKISIGVCTEMRRRANEARKGKPLEKVRKPPNRPVAPRKPPVPLPPPLPAAAFPEPLGGEGIHFLDMGRAQCRRPLWGVEARIGNVCGLPVRSWPDEVYCPACSRALRPRVVSVEHKAAV